MTRERKELISNDHRGNPRVSAVEASFRAAEFAERMEAALSKSVHDAQTIAAVASAYAQVAQAVKLVEGIDVYK